MRLSDSMALSKQCRNVGSIRASREGPLNLLFYSTGFLSHGKSIIFNRGSFHEFFGAVRLKLECTLLRDMRDEKSYLYLKLVLFNVSKIERIQM